MARYIDADKAIEVIVNTPSMVGSKYDFDHNVLTALVDREHEITDLINNNVQTSDVAPVVHAHWKWKLADNGWADTTCSNCGHVWNMDVHVSLDYDYCPYCGSKMDEEIE